MKEYIVYMSDNHVNCVDADSCVYSSTNNVAVLYRGGRQIAWFNLNNIKGIEECEECEDV